MTWEFQGVLLGFGFGMAISFLFDIRGLIDRWFWGSMERRARRKAALR